MVQIVNADFLIRLIISPDRENRKFAIGIISSGHIDETTMSVVYDYFIQHNIWIDDDTTDELIEIFEDWHNKSGE